MSLQWLGHLNKMSTPPEILSQKCTYMANCVQTRPGNKWCHLNKDRETCPTGQLYSIIRHAIAQISAKTVTQYAQYGEESGSRKKANCAKITAEVDTYMPQDRLAKYYVSCCCLESGSSSDMLPAIIVIVNADTIS